MALGDLQIQTKVPHYETLKEFVFTGFLALKLCSRVEMDTDDIWILFTSKRFKVLLL